MSTTKKCLIVLSIVAFLGMALLGGCASPTIDSWAERGVQGLTASHDHIAQLADRLQKDVEQQQSRDVDEAFDEILDAAQGKIEGVTLDKTWLKEHQAGLMLLLKLNDKEKQDIQTAENTAYENLEQIKECFSQIKRLRRSWGKMDELSSRVEYLAGLVSSLVANSKTK